MSQADINAMKKRIAELEMENEILKKANFKRVMKNLMKRFVKFITFEKRRSELEKKTRISKMHIMQFLNLLKLGITANEFIQV